MDSFWCLIMLVVVFLLVLLSNSMFYKIVHHKQAIERKHQLDESKSLLKEMLEQIDALVVLLKADGTIRFANDAFEKATDSKIKEKDYHNISEFFKNESLKFITHGLEYVSEYKMPYTIENHIIYKKKDQEITLKISMGYIKFAENSLIVLTANDITREVKLAKVKDIVIRLNNMLSKYHSLDDYFDDILNSLIEVIPYVQLGSILLVDKNNCMTMRANVGYNNDKAKNFKLQFEESFFYRCCGEDRMNPIIINDLSSYSMDGIASILDNVYGVEVASSLSSPIIIDGELRGLLNLDSSKNNIFSNEDLEIMKFLTEQISLVLTSHQLLNKTIYLSRFDQLTGLYNRWYLNELESSVIPHCLRQNEYFYYVMMDVNNLKIINDRYGHITGDAYLKEFSSILKKHSRETDALVRIGGDEFVGIYFEIDKDSLINKMNTINKNLKAKMIELGISEECSFAYGFIRFPQESQVLDEFIKIADERMYLKKKEMKKHAL